MPAEICEPELLARNGHRQICSGENKNYARTTTSQRNFDLPQASTLGSDIEVPPYRSALPAREGQKELLAFVPSL
jgi:hypothetical protein